MTEEEYRARHVDTVSGVQGPWESGREEMYQVQGEAGREGESMMICMDEPLFLECMCYSDEHVLRWDLLDDLEYPELYASVFLNQYRNIFKRMWVAVKYVLGYKCRYGHWDCFLLNPQDIGRMTALLDAYQEAIHDVA